MLWLTRQVQYGDVIINTNTVRMKMKAIFEPAGGPNYVYTHYQLHVIGIFNPAATAYERGPGGPIAPKDNGAIAANIPGPTTAVAVENALQQPRQRLKYMMGGLVDPATNVFRGGNVVLESPWSRPNVAITMDDKNGPWVEDFNVKEVHGTKTFIVELLVHTWVNTRHIDIDRDIEIPITDLILSNTYRVTDTVDEQFMLSRFTKGKLVLSTMLMEALENGVINVRGVPAGGFSGPDDFRTAMFKQLHPIPLNTKRHDLHVEVAETNDALIYDFTDEERIVNLIQPNITNIKAKQRYVKKIPDLGRTIYNVGKAGFEMGIKGFVVGAGIAEKGVPGVAELVGVGLGVAGFGGGFVAGAALAAANPDNIPTTTHVLDMELWGNRNSTKTDLLQAANVILKNQMARALAATALPGLDPKNNPIIAVLLGAGAIDQNLFLGETTVDAEFDLMGRYLHVRAEATCGVLQRIVGLLSGIVGQVQEILNSFNGFKLEFEDGPAIPGILGGGNIRVPKLPLNALGHAAVLTVNKLLAGQLTGTSFSMPDVKFWGNETVPGVFSNEVVGPNNPAKDLDGNALPAGSPIPNPVPPGDRISRGSQPTKIKVPAPDAAKV